MERMLDRRRNVSVTPHGRPLARPHDYHFARFGRLSYPLFRWGDMLRAVCLRFQLYRSAISTLSFGHRSYLAGQSAVGRIRKVLRGGTMIPTGTAQERLRSHRRFARDPPAEPFFAMITLALAQMMYFFAVQAKFTGGEDGIQAVPRGHLFGLIDLRNEMAMYTLVLVIFLAGFMFIYRIIHSPFGEVLKAIRENETRAISLGYKTDRYKLVAFILSATLAGVAGATKAIVLQLASLTDVNWPMSGEVVLMTLVGGLGTIFGPVVGAFVILVMQFKLAPIGEWVLVIQGAIFVACVLLFRRGIVGELAHILRIRL
jgi:branched-chain amino acid transport system permease protein